MYNSAVILLHWEQSCLRYYFHPLAGNSIYLCFWSYTLKQNKTLLTSGQAELVLRLSQCCSSSVQECISYLYSGQVHSLIFSLKPQSFEDVALGLPPCQVLNYNVLCPWENWRRFIRTRCQNVSPSPASGQGSSSTWKDTANTFCPSNL